MNTPGARGVSLKTIDRYKNFRRSRNDALEHYRNEWLSVLAANPQAGRNQLMAAGNFLYLWLNKNDSEWLEANLPPARRFIRRGELKDWKSIDIELAAKVKTTANRLRKKAGQPKWVCLAAIVGEVGHKGYFEHRLNKLPLTAIALDTHLESLEAYTIRKVEWAEACYQREGHCPSRSKLIRRAVVQNKVGNTLPVQNAIDAAMGRLQRRFLL